MTLSMNMRCDLGSNTASRYGPNRLGAVNRSRCPHGRARYPAMSVLERRDQPGVVALHTRLAPLSHEEVVTMISSYEAQMRGWMAYLAQIRSVAQQVTAYRRL
jgi:hypothetical protein